MICLQGRIARSRSSPYWLAEVPDLDLVTQGSSRRDGASMLKDAVESLVERPRFEAVVSVQRTGACTIGSNDDAVLVALMLRRLRGREGLTVREVARRLGSASPNAYAKYETGRVAPGIDTLARLLTALNPRFEAVLRVA